MVILKLKVIGICLTHEYAYKQSKCPAPLRLTQVCKCGISFEWYILLRTPAGYVDATLTWLGSTTTIL